MYFIALEVSYSEKNIFKDLVKSIGMKCRYDYRMKRWEIRGKKPTLKSKKTISEKFKIIHEWQIRGNKDIYKQSVYQNPKIKKAEKETK